MTQHRDSLRTNINREAQKASKVVPLHSFNVSLQFSHTSDFNGIRFSPTYGPEVSSLNRIGLGRPTLKKQHFPGTRSPGSRIGGGGVCLVSLPVNHE